MALVKDIASNIIACANSVGLKGKACAASVTLGSYTNHKLHLITNSAIRSTFDTSGNFGIGTDSPGARLDVRGSVIFNEAGGDNDVRMEGDTEANLFFLDASTDRIGIGTATPATNLHVEGDICATGDLTVGGDDIIMGTNTAGYFMVSNGTSFTPVAMGGDIGLSQTGATTIQAGAVDLSMMACCVITLADGSDNSTAIALGGTMCFNGTANEVEVAESSGTITVGLPATVSGLTCVSATCLGGTLQTAAQANVTSVGTLTSLDASGAVSFDGGTFVFNESGADKDFRIEGDTEANLFITDASTDRVGIGTATPTYLLDVAGNAGFDEYIYHNGDTDTFIRLQPDEINIEVGGENMIFMVEGGGGDQADKVTINNDAADVDFQVKGDTDTNLIRTDASNDRVGIGTATPSHLLDVEGVANFATCIVTPTVCTTGNTVIGGDLTVAGDDITLGTNTSGYILVADGTNYNPVAVSGDVTISSAGAITIAAGSVENSMLANCIITLADGSDNSTAIALGGTMCFNGTANEIEVAEASGILTIGLPATVSGLTTVSATTLTGTLSTAAQANITSVGTLSSLCISGTLDAGGNVSLNGGSFVFNEAGADKDFRIEGDTEANLFYSDASTDRIGIGTATPSHLLDVEGVANFATCIVTPNVCATSCVTAGTGFTGTLLTAAQGNITSVGNLSSLCVTGDTVVGGDLTIAGDDLTMGTNTSGFILVADGTNYNPVAISGDVAIDSAGAVTIQALSVDNSMLAGSIANAKLSNSSVSYGGISLSLGGSDATPAFDLADATNYPTSSLVGTITNAQLAGSIANAKLSNSTVTYGGVQISLGGSDGTPAFDLSDATAYPGDSSLVTVGTISSGGWEGTAIATGYIATTLTSKTLTDPVLNGTLSGTAFLDEDDFASDSDIAAASQQSIKAYVDAVASGLDLKSSSHVATTACLTSTYANGSSGVGATLTNAGTQAALSIDGQAMVAAERALIKDQTAACHNGIYTVTTIGTGSTNWVMTRATDFDTSTEITSGSFTFVETGTTNADAAFVMTTDGTITVGTTAISWTQFSGAGQITAGAGMTKSGSTLNVIAGSNITVNADDVQVSTSVTGLNCVAATCVGGTLYTAAQANVTSVGTLTSLCSSGDITLGGDLTITGDDLFMATNTSGYLLIADGTNYNPTAVSGDVTIDSSGATTIGATSVTNAMLAGSIANAKLSNSSVSYGGISVSLGSADATPAFDLADATNYPTSSLVGTITNAQLAGSIANGKLANSTITLADDDGNSTAISLGSTMCFKGTANEVETGESSGIVTIGLPATVSGLTCVSATCLGGTLQTAAQANITSVGTLTSICTSGALEVGGATQLSNTVTVGVDNTGYDVTFFGATTGCKWLWDENVDDMIITGGSILCGTLTVGLNDTGHDVTFYGATSGCKWVWSESANGMIITGTGCTTGDFCSGADVHAATCIVSADLCATSCVTAGTGFTGTLLTAAQANVTSVGTLTSLTVSGDVIVDTTTLAVNSTTNRVGIGTATPSHLLDVDGVAHIATCVITPIYCVTSQYVLPSADGSAGQVMCTDGSGGLAFATNTPASPGGSDTYVQFNDGGSFGGSASLTWDDTTFTVLGPITTGVSDAGHDITFFGNTANCKWLWSTSADDMIVTGGSILCGTLTVGLNDTGHDVTFFGATSGCKWLWDEDANRMCITGVACVTGDTVIGGDLTIAGDDLTMATNTSGALLVADGTNYNPAVMSGDASISSAGAVTLAATNTNLTTLANVTTIGTIGSGTWQGTAIALAYGGTGLVGATDGKIVIADGSGAPVLLDVGSSTAITILGTVATGTWQGTAIANAYLANSSVSYGGVSVSLGSTDATPAFDLSDATAYPGDSSLVTTGALDSGSITSGFGTIDTGSSTITTTGAVSAGALTASGNVGFDGGTFIFNESGADKDFRIEGDTQANLFITDASTDRVGIGTATPSHLVDIEGVGHASTCFVSADLCATTKVVGAALCVGGAFVLPTSDGSAGQVMCTDGSGGLAFATNTPTSPGGSDTYVQFNNGGSFGGSANLIWNGSTLTVATHVSTTCLTGTLQTAAQASITSVGTLSSLCVSGTLDVGGNVSLNGGTFVFNEAGADKDFRIEGDSEANLFIADASTDRIGIGTATPSHLVDIEGVGHASTCFVSADLCATTKIVGAAICMGGAYALPTSDGTAGYILCTDGSGAVSFAEAGGAGHTIAEDGTPLTARTCLNFIGTAVTATDNSGTDATDVSIGSSAACILFTIEDGSTDNIVLTGAATVGELACDTSPALGGNLDVTGYNFYTSSNNNICLAPNGTGKVCISTDLVIGGDDLYMATNTSGYILVADGTNYNPVAVSGDVTISSAGAITIAAGAVENSMLANCTISYGGIQLVLGGTDATPAFDLSDATAYVGDSSLVTVGTVTSGTWQGTAVATGYIATTLASKILTAPVLCGTISGTSFLDEDNMASDSATSVASQQSIKAYVDSVASGLDVKCSSHAATTACLTSTYSNGSSGVGATLTNAGTQAVLSLDGQTMVAAERVLIKDQTAACHNGIYTVTTVGDGSTNWVVTRATDFDSSAEVTSGLFTFVETGTTNADSGWVMTSDGTITIGTTAINWSQFSGAGQITAGAGLTKSGNTLTVGAGSNITVNADDVALSTTITGLTALTSTAITGTLQTAAQANVTSLGNLSSLCTTGDICVGADVHAATCIVSPVYCVVSEFAFPTADGTAGYIMCTDGSGTVGWVVNTTGHTIAEEGSALANRTCLNFIGAGVTATDNSGTDATDVTIGAESADLPSRLSDGTQCCITLSSAAIGPALVCDTTPQLGGNLDVNSNSIVSASNGNIPITPNGSGIVILDGICHPTADGSAGQVLCTNGSAALQFATITATSPGGSDTYVQFNDSSSFGGSANFTWDDTTVKASNFCTAGTATLATVDINAGAIDGTTIGAASAAAITATTITGSGNISFDGGTFTFNESGADKDFRIEGDTDANLFIADASTDRIGIGTATPSHLLDVDGVAHVATCLITPKLCITSQYVLPTADGSAGQIVCTDGSGTTQFADAASSGHTIAEDGSALTSRTCLNFVGSAVTATDNSGTNATDVTVCATSSLLGVRAADGTACCITLSSAAVGESLVSDTSPQLGGDLDVNGNSIVSDASNENIPITPHGTGSVVISKLSVTGDTSLDGGGFVFNDSGADKDFRIEGDSEANLFITDASTDRIGIGTATPSHLVDIEGVGHAATCFVSADLCATTKVVGAAICMGGAYAFPTSDGSAGQLMCTDGSGGLAFATASAGVTLAGSTNNTIATVTGANALAGEALFTYDAAAEQLTLTGAATPAFTITDTTTPTSLTFNIDNDTGHVWTTTNHALSFGVNTVAKMTIATDGNVGIGTTAPDNILDIEDDFTGGTKLEITNTSTGGNRWQMFATGSATGVGAGHLGFYNITDAVWGPIFYDDGLVTLPNQSAFLTRTAGSSNNATGDGTSYTFNYGTEEYDRNGNMSGSTFTAPVDGIYAFSGSYYLEGITTSHTTLNLNAATTSNTIALAFTNPGAMESAATVLNETFSFQIDMAASDTMVIRLQVSNGAKVVDVMGSTNILNSLQGYLVA